MCERVLAVLHAQSPLPPLSTTLTFGGRSHGLCVTVVKKSSPEWVSNLFQVTQQGKDTLNPVLDSNATHILAILYPGSVL